MLKINEPLILASSSPRRVEILSNIYKNINVQKINFEEKIPNKVSIDNVTQFLAENKMYQFLEKNNYIKENVITADTLVYYEDTNIILGKPKNIKEAKNMLLSHFGKRQTVISSACYYDYKRKKTTIISDKSYVTFKKTNEIPNEHISKYLELLPPLGPLDKAGAYGIQEKEVSNYMIEKIEGDLNNIIGFPLKKFISIIINISSGNN
jgi:septum formation protein